jgi:DNA/RNA endonuclease YhcR with UshA esterase domain
MRTLAGFLLFVVLALVSTLAFPSVRPVQDGCVPLAEALQHLGSAGCVRGVVLHVETGGKGVTFLNFCEDTRTCPFSVVVFPADIQKMGDIHQLEGQQVEIKGTIQDYDGRAQIVLRHPRQLGDGAFLLVPPVPSEYDVERRGHYSAGKYSHPKAAKKKHKKQGAPVSIEDPEEP